MSLAGKKSSNIFIVFIVILLYTETVTSRINYNGIRKDYHPYGDQAEVARTTRQILTMINNRAIHRPILDFQQATEHFLHFGALLRIQILDIFGPLVYDHHGDYNDQQTGALHRVYQETLEKKYNIFNIVPSILRNPDIRPTNLCRHIHKYVHTCLKESSVPCMTINKNDRTHMHSSLPPILNLTKQMYKRFYMKERFSNGFSLPAILDHLKLGTLKLTVGLISGLVHNIQYDSFDDEVRTSERNVMIILKSEMFGSDAHKVLMKKDSLLHIHTVSDLFKELSRLQRTTRRTAKTNANFAIISEHVVDEVPGINKNIVLLSAVYNGNKIDMKYLLDLILPPDVVDEDITDAKNYLLKKINDYNIVDEHLEIDKYQQSSPDQLLLEILGQMIDIDFAVDIVTALHVHAHFWQQSHMINNLDALLWLFDAYENLQNVPEYSSFMSLTDKIRNNLRDSNNVTVEISCNNPRVCLRLGLETVIESEFIDAEIKNDIDKLFHNFNELKVIHNAGECTVSIESVEKSDELQTEKNPTRINGEDITDRNHREELGTTEVSTVETASMESEEASMPTTNAEDTTTVLTTDGNASSLTTTDIFNEFLAINTEDTSIQMTTLSPQDATETMEQHQTTDSIDEELTTTSVTITKPVFPDVSNELTTETQGTTSTEHESERLTEQSTTDEELRTQETTSTEHESERLTEQSTTDEELRTQETTSTEHESERLTEQSTTDEELRTQETTSTEHESERLTEQSTTDEELRTQETTSTEHESERLTEQSTTDEELRTQETTSTEHESERLTEQSTTDEELRTQETTSTEHESERLTEQSTTDEELRTQETTSTEHESERLTEQSTTDEELRTQETTSTEHESERLTEQSTTDEELRTQETTSTEHESERLTEQSTTDEELRTQEATSTEHESERWTEQSTTDEDLRTQETTTREQRISGEEVTTQEAATTERKSTESTEQSSPEKETTTTPGESTIESMIADATIIPKNDDDCHGNPCTPEISNNPIAILDGDVWHMVPWHSTSPPLSQYNTGVAERISEEEVTTQEAATTERKSTESTEQSSPAKETTTTPGESTIESMIADATIIPKNDDDCHGNPCTPEISIDPIAILDGDVWHMVPWHSTSPPLSQYNTGVAETLPLTTTTVIPTTRENLMMTTTVPAVTTTSSSAFASGEDCSGEACTSNDCFGVGCQPHASSEVINESTDCSDGTNCNINGQTDCNEDGSCITDSSTDQCDDNNCKTNTDEQNYQHDCSGDDCLSTVEVSEKTDGCEGDECSRPSSERDDLSTGHSLTDSKIPDCVDDDCSDVSESNESTCNDDTCVNSDESQPSSGMQETDPAFPASTSHSVPRDNEDSMNTPRATTPTPPDRTGDKLGEADIPEKLPSPKPTRRVPIKFRLKLPSQKLPLWLRLPRNKISDNYSPWRPTTQQPLQTHELKKKEFGHQSLGVGIKNRTSSKALLNINTNINVSGQRQYTDKDTEHVTTPGPHILNINTKIHVRGQRQYTDKDTENFTTPGPHILQMMNSSNSSYRRVVTEVPNGLGSDKKDQKSNLELKVQAEKSPKISRRRQVSPMKTKPDVYRRKGSDDKIERMKKRRSSTIRASQRPSMRYLR